MTILKAREQIGIGMSLNQIIEITNLTKEEIEKIKKLTNKNQTELFQNAQG